MCEALLHSVAADPPTDGTDSRVSPVGDEGAAEWPADTPNHQVRGAVWRTVRVSVVSRNDCFASSPAPPNLREPSEGWCLGVPCVVVKRQAVEQTEQACTSPVQDNTMYDGEDLAIDAEALRPSEEVLALAVKFTALATPPPPPPRVPSVPEPTPPRTPMGQRLPLSSAHTPHTVSQGTPDNAALRTPSTERTLTATPAPQQHSSAPPSAFAAEGWRGLVGLAGMAGLVELEDLADAAAAAAASASARGTPAASEAASSGIMIHSGGGGIRSSCSSSVVQPRPYPGWRGPSARATHI